MASTSAWLRLARGLQLQRWAHYVAACCFCQLWCPHILYVGGLVQRDVHGEGVRVHCSRPWLGCRRHGGCEQGRHPDAVRGVARSRLCHSCNGAPHSLAVWGCSYDDGVVVDDDSQVISVGGAPLDPHRVYVVGTARWEARSNKALHPYASAGWDCSFDPSQVHARVHCRYLVEHPEAMAGPDADYLVKALLLRYWGHTEDSSHCSDSG